MVVKASYKKVNNAQVGQSRANPETVNTSDSNPGSGARSIENGGHLQPALQGVSTNIPSPVAVTNSAGAPPQKTGLPLPRAPSSSTNSDSTLPCTLGNGAKGFPLQFGSISPEFMNEMRVGQDASKVVLAVSLPFGLKQDLSQKAVALIEKPVTQERMSMPLPFQQPTVSMKFGGHDPQIQSQAALQVPLQTGNDSQIPQQVFVPGYQIEHSLVQITNQSQNVGYNHQLPYQLSRHLENVKFGRPGGVSQLDRHRNSMIYGDKWNKQRFPPFQDPRKLKGILNKLTPQNFERLFNQVMQIKIDNVITLNEMVSQIFDKAVTKPNFCEMYANFCQHLASELPDFSVDNKKITFRRLLLNKCQEEFERREREEQEACNVDGEGSTEQSVELRKEKRVKARRRMLGNIRLIGELYKKRMLTERIMHECIKKLLGQYQNPDEENIEALCKLMSTIGEMIDHPKAKEDMDADFEIMRQLSNNMVISSRVRFMLKDVIDLRKNKWQQKKRVEGAKKIEDIHRDEQTQNQVQQDASSVVPAVPLPFRLKQDLLKKAVALAEKPVTRETKTEPLAKRDVILASTSPPTQAQKPSTLLMTGISMPFPPFQQQSTGPVKFGGPKLQVQSRGALQLPLQVGNPSQIPQQVFVPGLQVEHSLIQTKKIMHQGQNVGYNHQLPHYLGNVKLGRPGGVSQLYNENIVRKM